MGLKPRRIAVLLSGRGSNLRALHEAIAQGRLMADLVAVGSDQPQAAGVAWAREQGLSVHVCPRTAFADRAAFESALLTPISAAQPDWLILAGFMRVLSAQTVAQWQGRMLNLHPSLLPRHPGLDTHRKALSAGDAEHGASVHFVSEVLDGGPVIAQVAFPLDPTATPESLAVGLQPLEHRLLTEVVGWAVAGRLSLREGRVQLDDQTLQAPRRL